MKITLIGNKRGVYINPVDNNAFVDYNKAVNIKDVNLFGVNNLVIRRNEDGGLKIVQAGGYNRIRGLFTDLYN